MKTARKSNKPTAEEITTPIAVQCTKCGGRAVIYPAPSPPQGVCYCPCSSPAWLESFAIFSTSELRAARGLPREFVIKELAVARTP
jgi:hypothetical protein